MINYFDNSLRSSPLNFIVIRIVVGVYAIWKLVSYDFELLEKWPRYFFENHQHGVLLAHPWVLQWIEIEVGIVIIMLIGFMIGYRLGIVTFIAALLLSHLTAMHYIVTNSGATFLPTIYLLILWGLYRDTDPYQIGKSKSELEADEFDFSILKWFLLIVGASYFFTGYVKVTSAFSAWLNWRNLALLIHREALMHLEVLPSLGAWLLNYPTLLWVSSIGTLFLELGFLIVILLRKIPLWPFLIGLFGFHAIIALAMNIFFFDQYILLALFLPWDEWIQPYLDRRNLA